MLILGIETSCDDTSIAVLKAESEQFEVLSNVVSSQIQTHAPYGGVVPVLAAREHEKNLPVVLSRVLHDTGYMIHDMDLVAVTSGPGLIMSLVKGVNFAKELAQKNNKKIIGINHMAGHIYSNWLSGQTPEFPALCLIVSGGHTELVLMHNHGKYELVGRTVDDASGEAFDKIARLIGLEYPGGPSISREADKFQASSTKSQIKLPRPMIHSKDFNFSFSGLKTSVLYLVRDLKSRLKSRFNLEMNEEIRAEIAHEAQEAIVDVSISKTKKAIELYRPKSVLLAGGVSANKLLRKRFDELALTLHVTSYTPDMKYTTDNAAMIAIAAYHVTRNIDHASFPEVRADANWEIV